MKVEIITKRRVFDSFFKVDEAELRYERFDGSMTPVLKRQCFERGDSVAALLFHTGSRQLLLGSQFKYPTFEKGPGWITEVIAGTIDNDETPEAAVQREVEEETGYRILSSRHISTFYVSPGGTSERIWLYYAEVSDADRKGKGGGIAAEGEDIKLITLSPPEAADAIASGEIQDAKTLIALLWFNHEFPNGAAS
ncbi:MAG: NUDIX hydrolase [Acidobacteriales bacterium]|nr:NUDIX hydrolase [Terriglobales bacterium]